MHLFLRNVPVWLWLGSLVAVVGIGATAIFYFSSPVYNYALTTPPLSASELALTYGATPALGNANFYAQVKDGFIAQKADFISADLTAMKISLYKGGVLAKEFPILAKGKVGSWWETPTGLYKVEVKEPSHFSSIAGVAERWDLYFQGNFFIHGWPYYPDGTPVPSTFSGGCIRLSDADAKVLYDGSSVGMPVIVYKERTQTDQHVFSAVPPQLSASEYLVADINSGFVFLSKGQDTQVPIASVTKLVTGLVTTAYLNLDTSITVPAKAIVPTSKARLVVGDKYSVYELLQLLLMESSNEAAETLAQKVGRSYFMSIMNAQAKSIGMTHTTLTDPAGREDGNVSTATDLFTLARYLLENRKFIFTLSADHVTVSPYDSKIKGLQDFNDFTDDPDFVGGKVGETTAAKQTAIYIFNMSFGGEKRPVAFIILHSDDRKGDATLMRNFIERTYQ